MAVHTDNGSIRRIAFFFAVVFVFIMFSSVSEIIGTVVGGRWFLPAIFGFPAIAGVFLSDGLARLRRVRTSYYCIAFSLWLVVATPFSHWPGGSVEVLFEFLPVAICDVPGNRRTRGHMA